MELLAQQILDEIKAFTNEPGDSTSIDKAIGTTQLLLEKLYILRYKSYETGLIKESNNSIPEFDLAGFDTEPEPVVEPINKPTPVLFDLPTEEPSAEPIQDSIFDTPSEMPLESNHTEEESSSSYIEVEAQTEEPTLTSSIESLDLNELISNSHGKHEKIDNFNGNYSLKEKITFINELFKGSSESFGSAVKQIDSHATMSELMPTLNFLSVTHEWKSANPEALKKFIEKVVAKYA
jgi:hypothetical protein